MNRRIVHTVLAVLLASWFATPVATAQRSVLTRAGDSALRDIASAPAVSNADVTARQDGRLLVRPRWISPHGELPGTLAEYLRWHPYRPALFSEPMCFPAGPGDRGLRDGPARISILIDETLYLETTDSLDAYVADLVREGYAVVVQTVSGGTPEDIKAWVADQYGTGSGGMLFIGDVTAAWAEVSGSVFPCDLFFMDIDGHWEDADQDGDYEIHTAGNGDEGPEVYVARVYAHTLTYNTEANMVNDYLAKAGAYRRGTLTQPRRGLEYVDEDWYSMDVALDEIYADDIVRHDFGYFTRAGDYLDQMDLGQHFVQVCAHSYSAGHHFGTRPTESAVYAHVYVYSPSQRDAKLVLGSNDGICVWLNSALVCTHDVYQGWSPGQFRHDVVLDEGWNQLLCKISQGGGDYQFSATFRDMNYNVFDDLRYQLDDPDEHAASGPYIRCWLLNGFHQDESDNFWSYLGTNYLGVPEGSADPQEGEEMGGQVWTRQNSDGPYIDMNAYSGDANFGACYAFVRVYADSEQDCELWMGYDDGALVWLNGRHAIYDNRYGGYEADMTKVPVTLKAGVNRLLVKVSEWMGAHGFSARFCQPDGSPVEGLSYDPTADAIAFIGTWLLNGPYANADQSTRLTEDYLGDEANVRPSEGDPAPMGTWERDLSSGFPVDLNEHYNGDGGWVFSDTVQDRDPPVLFYNLFSCGPGRFTDANYLAGAYIFNTTYGLITVASSKSGSMLNFRDFTRPLGMGQSVGQAFQAWFDAQAPFEDWERSWYYGMVLCGDPALRPTQRLFWHETDGSIEPEEVVPIPPP